ncbi:MAG: metallophosphoesterase [Deltaproteobacteria bacterium]|nr:metallophosphoesterase [Deltaproteobacteria bacterium]
MPGQELRARRFRRFLAIAVAVTVLIQIPPAVVVAGVLGRLGLARPLFWTSLSSLVFTAQFFVRFRPGRGDRPRSRLAKHVFDLPFFVHWSSSFVFAPLSIVAGIVGIGWSLAAHGDAALPPNLLPAVWATCLALAIYAVYVRRRRAVVRDVIVRVPDLPTQLDGFRIVQLSDLHVGSLTPATWLEEWVERVNELEADLVAVTGDLLSSGNGFMEAATRALGRLRAREGVVFAMGNHDYFGDPERLVGELESQGVEVLRNEGRLLTHRGASLWLAGVDDTWQGRDDLETALASRPEGVPALLLAHDPKVWPRAVAEDVTLTLSGHTHGAQLAVPFASRRCNLAMLGEPYSLGLYSQGRCSLYVHAGLGTTGPPARLGVAPEIACITLLRS